MPQFLCVTVRFLDPVPTFHGQRDGGEPEWPPSPLRLFQALVDAAANRWRELNFGEYAQPFLVWLERLDHPEILAPMHHFGAPFRLSGPNNDMDAPARKWVKGEEPIKPHRPMDLRTMKAVLSTYIRIGDGKLGDSLHYIFALPNRPCEHLEILQAAARSITHLGWGIDMAVGDASIIPAEEAAKLEGVRWHPSPAGGVSLRVPKQGTLSDLMRKHTDFLNRISSGGFRPVPPLRVFDVVQYRSQYDTASRPFRLFELRNLDGSRCRYSHRKLIHIAGMVRHLAIEAMKTAGLPRGVAEDWVETYVAGHRKGRKVDLKEENKCKDATDTEANDEAALARQREAFDGTDEHRQLSYIPLPSVGHEHADPGVRRVMIVAPLGDDVLLDQVARRLGGQQLKPLNETTPEFGFDENNQPKPGPLLVPLPRGGDGVTRQYTGAANTWASVTPVILPGHDDHKPDKTRRLILKALQQSGIDQPCEFEWSAFSVFPKSLSAHKYDRQKRPDGKKNLIGYIRPDHLLNLSAVHLRIRFEHDRQVPGPLAIGAGRHCGLGIFARVDER